MAPPLPRVSVVMPAYNRRAIIHEAIDSLRAQTLGDWELLVADDGSTDDTAGVVRERYGDDARVRLFRQLNRGPSSARNLAIRHARGEFLSLLDTDDLYLPRCLEAHVGAMVRHPEAGMTIGDVRYAGGWPSKWTTWFARRSPPLSGADMCRGGYVLPVAVMMRTAVMKALTFDESIRNCEDTEMMFRFFDAGHGTVILDEVVGVYRRLGAAAGAGQLTLARGMRRRRMLELQERYAHMARGRRSHRRLLARRWTRYHLKYGDLEQAKSAARRWWTLAPWDVRAPLTILRAAASARREAVPASGPTPGARVP